MRSHTRTISKMAGKEGEWDSTKRSPARQCGDAVIWDSRSASQKCCVFDECSRRHVTLSLQTSDMIYFPVIAAVSVVFGGDSV